MQFEAKSLWRMVLLFIIPYALWGCSTTSAFLHYFKSTDHYRTSNLDQRVLYEQGAERFAEIVVEVLPPSVETVEHDLGGHFTKEIKVYLSPKYGSYWKLEPHMFYRQAALFVSFLREHNSRAFKEMLKTMQCGQSFDLSFQRAYSILEKEMWRLFINQIDLSASKETL